MPSWSQAGCHTSPTGGARRQAATRAVLVVMAGAKDRRSPADRLKSAERQLDDLFREIRRNTERTRELRDRYLRRGPASTPEAEQPPEGEPVKPPDSARKPGRGDGRR
jgi:hypothetical protein